MVSIELRGMDEGPWARMRPFTLKMEADARLSSAHGGSFCLVFGLLNPNIFKVNYSVSLLKLQTSKKSG